jgi:hypothetical protein
VGSRSNDTSSAIAATGARERKGRLTADAINPFRVSGAKPYNMNKLQTKLFITCPLKRKEKR